jgi:hypothetical protein
VIIDQYYVNNSPIKAQTDTGLAADELEQIVGRFPRHHERQGHLKGEVVIYADGSVKIRHHFTKKVLWES